MKIIQGFLWFSNSCNSCNQHPYHLVWVSKHISLFTVYLVASILLWLI